MRASKREDAQYNGSTEIPVLYYILIAVTGIFCIAVGNFIYDSHKMWGTFSIEVGIAFIIALLVIFTIERFQRKHQNAFLESATDAISNSVLTAVYKRFIPEEVFCEVEECLLASNVIRRDHEIHYSITSFPNGEHNNHVLCEATSTYKLENITNNTITQSVMMVLEKPVRQEFNKFCKINDIKINEKSLGSEFIAQNTKDTNDTYRFITSVKIKPREIISVISTATLVKYKLDIENWELKHPSSGVRLSLQCSDPALNLELYANARHNKELEIKLDRDDHKVWELNHGTLPHQSVVMWWKERNHA